MSSSAIARMKTLMEKIMQISSRKRKTSSEAVAVSRKTANLFIVVEDEKRNTREAFKCDGSSKSHQQLFTLDPQTSFQF